MDFFRSCLACCCVVMGAGARFACGFWLNRALTSRQPLTSQVALSAASEWRANLRGLTAGTGTRTARSAQRQLRQLDMEKDIDTNVLGIDPQEFQEWVESFDEVVHEEGQDQAITLLNRLRNHAQSQGIALPFTANTPYINTIPAEKQPIFPGDQEIERRIKSLVRWNALAMVVRANRVDHSIGGHISTYASAATLFEVGFNHFFRARSEQFEGDTIYFQGHASPGVYARAFVEGRLSLKQVENFRREL